MSKAYQKKMLLYCYLTVLAGGNNICHNNKQSRPDTGPAKPESKGSSKLPSNSLPTATNSASPSSKKNANDIGKPPVPPASLQAEQSKNTKLIQEAMDAFQTFEKTSQEFYDTQSRIVYNHANPGKVFTTLSKEDQEKALKELQDKEPDYKNEQLIQALEGALNAVYSKINAAYYSSIANNYSPNSLGQKKPSEEEKKTIDTEFKKVAERYQFLQRRWGLISDLKNKKITADQAQLKSKQLQDEVAKQKAAKTELDNVKLTLQALVAAAVNYKKPNPDVNDLDTAIAQINATINAANPDRAILAGLFDGDPAAAGNGWLNAVNLVVAAPVSRRAGAGGAVEFDRDVEQAIKDVQNADIADVKGVVEDKLRYLKVQLEKCKAELDSKENEDQRVIAETDKTKLQNELDALRQAQPETAQHNLIDRIVRANDLTDCVRPINDLGQNLGVNNPSQNVKISLWSAIEYVARGIMQRGAGWDADMDSACIHKNNNQQYQQITRNVQLQQINDDQVKDHAIALIAIMHAIRLSQNVNQELLNAAAAAIDFTQGKYVRRPNPQNKRLLHDLQRLGDIDAQDPNQLNNAGDNQLGASMPDNIKKIQDRHVKKLLCFAALRVAAQHALNDNGDGAGPNGQRAANLRAKAHDNDALNAIVNAAIVNANP